MVDIYENIEEYYRNKKCKIVVVFDDMIADMLNNQKRNPIVIELFTEGRQLNISLDFITQSNFVVTKKGQTKFYTLSYYKNSKQMRVSTKRLKSFIRH